MFTPAGGSNTASRSACRTTSCRRRCRRSTRARHLQLMRKGSAIARSRTDAARFRHRRLVRVGADRQERPGLAWTTSARWVCSRSSAGVVLSSRSPHEALVERGAERVRHRRRREQRRQQRLRRRRRRLRCADCGDAERATRWRSSTCHGGGVSTSRGRPHRQQHDHAAGGFVSSATRARPACRRRTRASPTRR